MTSNHIPTVEQELLLRAALLPGDASLAAWRRLLCETDLDRLDGASRSLFPLVLRNVGSTEAGRPHLTALRREYAATRLRNQRQWDHVRPLLQALERARVEAIVLKGLALIARYYREPGLRPMADVDVLVPPAVLARATAVLTDLGWRSPYRVTPAFARIKHAAPFFHRRGVTCDLHWRVFEEPGDGGADDEFRAAAVSIRFQEAQFRVFAPADQLLHVCAHAARWAPVPPIRWVADATFVVRAGGVEWARLLAHTRRRRFVLRVREMLGYLKAAFGVDIPTEVLAELAACRATLLERWENRVRSREHPWLGELPTYLLNCVRGERWPLLALPRYLQAARGQAHPGRVRPPHRARGRLRPDDRHAGRVRLAHAA